MDNKSDMKQLFNNLKEYGHLQIDYIKLLSVEKITALFSVLILALLALLLSFGFLFFLTNSLKTCFAAYFDESVAYLLVAGIYVVLAAILIIFRKSLVINPLCRIISRIIIDKK